MDNATSIILEKVHSLSDLELATLTCLIADQHCIVQTHADLFDQVEHELKLVGSSHGSCTLGTI
jgi:hypothetical protein